MYFYTNTYIILLSPLLLLYYIIVIIGSISYVDIPRVVVICMSGFIAQIHAYIVVILAFKFLYLLCSFVSWSFVCVDNAFE